MTDKDAPLVSDAFDDPSGIKDDQPQLTEGMKLGRFVLLQAMGSGGMGSVYAAWDPDLGRRVALKVLHPETSSDGSKRARMLREARALAQLNHPNVVRVYELGETETFPYLVMELVDGESLGQLIRNGRLPQIEILRHFVQAADGLKAVHELGIVHRDIKPTNIFVGKDGRVCIGDFGLAVPGERLSEDVLRAQSFEATWQDEEETLDKELSQISAEEISLGMTLTRAGSLLGTPAFMSPEHLKGERVDERSDQFSFAISIWRGLFGCEPFPSARSLVCRLERMEGPPERPAAVEDDCNIVPILEKALQFDPERRYRNMAEFQVALRRCLEDASAPSPSLLTTRKSVLSVAAGLVLAITMGSFAWFQISDNNLSDCNAEQRLSLFRSPSSQNALRKSLMHSTKFDEKRIRLFLAVLDAYAVRWQSAAESVCRSPIIATPAVRACLESRLGDLNAITSLVGSEVPDVLPELHAAALALTPPDGCFQEVSNAYTDALPTSSVKSAREQIAHARALYLSGVYGEARRQAEQAKELATRAGANHEMAESSLILGQALAGAGSFPKAAQALRESISTALSIRAERIEAAAWGQLLFVVGDRQGNFEEGLRILPMARAAADRVSYDHQIISSARLAEALLWKGLRDAQKAEHAAREALDAADKRVPADARQKGRILCVLGLILGDQGRTREGIAEIQRAREVTTGALSETHMYVAVIDNNLGTLLMGMEDYDEAHLAFTRTLHSLEASPEEHRHILAAPLNNLGKIARHQRNLERAQSHFKRAHQLLLSTLGKEHRRTLIPQLALARIEQDRRAFSKADDMFEAVATVLQHTPDGQFSLAATRVEQALLALESGNQGKAARLLEEVGVFFAQHDDIDNLRGQWALVQMTRFILQREWPQAKTLWSLANEVKDKATDSAHRESLEMAERIFGLVRTVPTRRQPEPDAQLCTGTRQYSPVVRLLSAACHREAIE